jgi:hypothetical protein
LSGTLTVNNLSVNSGNCVVAGNIHNSNGLMYPGQLGVGNGGLQSSWYLASHGSYGLYCNTGLYVAGDVWASGVSVAGSLAGKHPLMTPGAGTWGAITLSYTTYSANHNNPQQLTAPAGGTGTAAGGWSTAANRDLAIASINAAKTDIANTKAVLGHVISALKAMGLLY